MTSFLVVSTSMTMKDPELQKRVWLIFLRFTAAAHSSRMNCDEMAGDRLTVCEQELLRAFARLVSISSNFLYSRSCASWSKRRCSL